jgi:hypothetical protein
MEKHLFAIGTNDSIQNKHVCIRCFALIREDYEVMFCNPINFSLGRLFKESKGHTANQ